MAYAVIQLQGKQYKVSVNDLITTDRLSQKEGETLKLDTVLLHVDGSAVSIGQPHLPLQVQGTVVKHLKGPKIRVATYKAKSRYRKVKGHRQFQSQIKIEKITPKSVPAKSTSKASSAPKTDPTASSSKTTQSKSPSKKAKARKQSPKPTKSSS